MRRASSGSSRDRGDTSSRSRAGGVAVHPPQHVDDAGHDRIVAGDRRRGDGGRDAVAGQRPGEPAGPPGRVAEEDGHVGPLDPLVAGGQQLGGDRLDLQRRVPARHQHGRRRAAEGLFAEVDAGGGGRGRGSHRPRRGRWRRWPGRAGCGRRPARPPRSRRRGRAQTCPRRRLSGEQVGGPAEEAGDVHPAQVGEGLAVPGKEPRQLGPGGVGVRSGRVLGRAVLQQQEGVGDLGHQRPAAEQVAERRPRRRVLLGQQPGDGAPLLGAGDQPDGPSLRVTTS